MRVQAKTKEQPKGKLMRKHQRIAQLTAKEADSEQVEAQLWESEEKIRLIFESIAEGMVVADLEGNIVQLNQAAVQMYGCKRKEELIGRSGLELITGKDRARAIENLKKTLIEGFSETIDYTLLRKDGGEFDAAVSATVLRGVDGNPMGFVTIVRDQTEHNQITKVLQFSDAAFGSIQESIIATDTEYIITNWNKVSEQIFGIKAAEAIGKKLFAVIGIVETSPGEGAERIKKLETQGHIRDEILHRIEYTEVWVDACIHEIIDDNGKRYGWIALVTDITARKRMEKMLLESEKRYRELADLLPQTIFELDERGNFTFANLKGFQSSGYTQEDLEKGLNALQLFIPEDREKVSENHRRILGGEKLGVGEYTALRKDGSTFPVAVSSSPIIHEGKSVGLRGIVIDITARKHYEAKIGRLNQLLHAIFNISELIAKEKDPDRLLKGVCDALVETRGYHHAWITLLDRSENLVAAAETGLGKDFLPLVKKWKHGWLPACALKALRQPKVVVTRDTATTCTDCPLANKHGNGNVLGVRLEHGERVYGLLSICTVSPYAEDEEELTLLLRIAGDIAFALQGIEVERQRGRAIDSLVELTKLL